MFSCFLLYTLRSHKKGILYKYILTVLWQRKRERLTERERQRDRETEKKKEDKLIDKHTDKEFFGKRQISFF